MPQVDKRYQVFVSSTFRDLAEERKIAFNAILRAQCFPAGMENFPALTGASLPYIYNLIDESDFFLLIIGGRYGSSRDRNGMSYTHLEARYAQQTGKPIIALYPLDWGKLDDKETNGEDITKLVSFIDEIKNKFDGAKPWKKDELSNLVQYSVEQAKIDHPEAIGWIRDCQFRSDKNLTQPDNAAKLRMSWNPPTIIESGDNANGKYTLLSNGEQECIMRFPNGLRHHASYNFVYPASFIDIPSIIHFQGINQPKITYKSTSCFSIEMEDDIRNGFEVHVKGKWK